MKSIYMARNNTNGKMYIGQTTNFRRRKNAHVRSALNCTSARFPFHNGLLKHSFNFTWEILLEVDDDMADDVEEYLIWFYRTLSPRGYNVKPGGSSCRFSEEQRKSMSENWKKRFDKPGVRERMMSMYSDPEIVKKRVETRRLRFKNDPVFREEMLKSQKMTNTPEINQIRRDRLKKLWEDPEYAKKQIAAIAKNVERVSKRVLCHQTGVVYKSQREMSRSLGINVKDIWNVLNGKTRQAKGYTFERVE